MPPKSYTLQEVSVQQVRNTCDLILEDGKSLLLRYGPEIRVGVLHKYPRSTHQANMKQEYVGHRATITVFCISHKFEIIGS